MKPHPHTRHWPMRAALTISRLSILLALSSALAQGQTPKTAPEIPVFPGAAQVAPDDRRGGCINPLNLFKAYHVRTDHQSVYKFYAQRLGARLTTQEHKIGFGVLVTNWDEVRSGEGGPANVFQAARGNVPELDRLRPAQTTPVFVFPSLDKLPDNLYTSTFYWARQEANSDLKYFEVDISHGLPELRQLGDEAVISFCTYEVLSEKSRQAEQEKAAQQGEREMQKREAELAAHPPSERELGMPVYPGARFDTKQSAASSRDKEPFYFYFSDDPPAKVTKFFEGQAGNKADEVGDGTFLVSFNETSRWSELYVQIEPAADKEKSIPGPAKTMITIRGVLKQPR